MSREQIVRDTAYAIWEAEGKPEGRAAEHWRQAEVRVAASVNAGSGQAKASKVVNGKAVKATVVGKAGATTPGTKALAKSAKASKTTP